MNTIKKLLSILLAITMLAVCSSAVAEDDPSLFADVWIEDTGYGTLTVFADGTARMDYYDGTVTECEWAVTEEGAKFTTGQWWNSPMVLTGEDTLDVADGWLTFTRESAVINAQPIDPVPVGEEGAPFLGTWMLETITFDGESFDPALFEMSMELIFHADGTVISVEDGEAITSVWAVEDGAAIVDGMPLTINEEDQLILEEDEQSFMVFVRGEAEPAVEPTEEEQLAALLALLGSMDMEEDPAADLPEALRGYVGTWHMVYTATGGLTGDLRTMGINCVLALNADGTGSIDFPSYEEAAWYDDEGIIRFGEDGMPMTLLDGGFLQYGSTMGGYMIFSQDAEAVYTPVAAAEPAATEAPAPAISAGRTFEQLTDYLEIRFVAESYTMAGQTYDAGTLGTEYSLLFHENGTCDFTLAGMAMPGLSWGLDSVAVGLSKTDAFAISYYGTTLNAVPTATGFDMDYYGSMMLHFVPAE